MKISFMTVDENLNRNNGFGAASWNIVRSLQKLGHEVPFRDPNAAVEFAFVQPDRVEWSNPDAHHILMTPFESDVVPAEWDAGIKSADEWWTTSNKCKEWFEKNGYKISNVFPHGVEDIWTKPKFRVNRGELRFLHLGSPAVRKNGQIAYEAFREAFGDQEDVSLTIKSYGPTEVRAAGSKLPQFAHKNVKVVTKEMLIEELVNFYYNYHVLIYPSSNEGFGLIPLEAMATGMPTMCVPDWAEYQNFLIPDLKIKAFKVRSPWEHIHPGNVYWPDKADMVGIMRKIYENFDHYANLAYGLAPHVARRYDWLKLTEQAFASTVARFENVTVK